MSDILGRVSGHLLSPGNLTIEQLPAILGELAGPGIDAADLERATDRFWRGAGSDQKPGSGLGLAIASDLLASVGGQLRVSAPPSGGLTVTFRFAKAVAS